MTVNDSTGRENINADSPIVRNGRLVSISPAEGEGSIWDLKLEEVRIGRGNDCDIRIDDDTISRLHAVIQRDASGYLLVDLNSTNGTYVNDKPIQRHRLVAGDDIQLGHHIFKFLAMDLVDFQLHQTVFDKTTTDELPQAYNRQHTATGLTAGLKWLCRTLKFDLPLSTKANRLRGRDAKPWISPRSTGHRRFRLIHVTGLAICLTLVIFGSIEACNVIFLKPTLVKAAYEGVLIGSQSGVSEAEIVERVQTVLSSRNIAGTNVAVDANGSSFDALHAGELFTVHVAATVAGNVLVPIPFGTFKLVVSEVVGHKQD